MKETNILKECLIALSKAEETSVKLTDMSREILRIRKQRKALQDDGFEEIGENGFPLGQLNRGGRWSEKIIEVRIGPCGKTVWIKTGKGA